MALGMIGRAMAAGAAQGLESYGNMYGKQILSQMEEEKQRRILELRQSMERDDATWKRQQEDQHRQELADKVRQTATQAATTERNNNLSKAEQIYREGGYLDGEDAPAINQALSEARSQPINPTNRQLVSARVEMGMTDPLSLEKLDVEREGHAEGVAMRREQMDETRRYHDEMTRQRGERIEQGNRRVDLQANRTGQLTPMQNVRNKEIDAARKHIDGLSEEEIKKRTQQYTNTGRENKDYDPQLANRVKRAYQRKVGDSDPWFDRQLGSGTDIDGITGTGPRSNDAILKDFSSDPNMRGNKLGKRTEKGFEIYDAAGKLIGHYE